MQKVLTAEQMREVDRLTTERYGIPSILLMENAAHAAARIITEKLGGSVKGKSILILCGPGNNGGDGAALGRLLSLDKADVSIILLGSTSNSKADALANFSAARSTVGSLRRFESIDDWNEWYELAEKEWDVVVDAIIGTGLTRPLTGWIAEVLEQISPDNAASRYLRTRLTFSIDVPTGLNADDSESQGPVFDADATITFTSPKRANVLPPACRFGGELTVAFIGSNRNLIDEVDSQLYVSERWDAEEWYCSADFSEDSYKNKRGHLLVMAGSESYSGAAVLCGNAAMRSGVGLVTIATPKSSKASVASRVLPEVMVLGVAETENGAVSEIAFDEIQELLGKVDSVAIGSGISWDESTKRFVQKVIENRRRPILVDADALNLLSPFAGFAANGESEYLLILTPHEGEFMRLLGSDDKEVIKDRIAAVRDFATKHNVILVLKGERVLIGEPGGKVVVNPTGNSGLGKAGNGDTLTGIIAGFVAQAVQFKIDIFETVVAAVYVAGMAGDVAEKKYGKRVMTASDVRECLADVFESLAGN